MKYFFKKNWFKISFVLISIIASFGFLKYVFDKKENSDFYKNQECQNENIASTYNSKTNKCDIENDKLPELPDVNFCDFEISDLRISQFHFDGPDYEKLRKLEADCSSGATLGRLTCMWADEEKKSKRKDTYIEIEGLLKSNRNERLKSVVSKIYTQGDNKILLGSGSEEFNRDVSEGESVPFKISILVDRNNDLIGKYFSKDDEVSNDTYPWFLTCE